MKTRPILFSGPMVQAILDGRKTQTRRVVKSEISQFLEDLPDPAMPLLANNTSRLGPGKIGREMVGVICPGAGYVGPSIEDIMGWCPYGAPGDRLWVRETWGLVNPDGYANCPSTLNWRADGAHRLVNVEEVLGMPYSQRPKPSWRPSIHMPRWASRITLEITAVRVERLQEISEADVQAEGCTGSPFGKAADAMLFPTLWDSINAKKHPWESNPWVWVVEFKRVSDTKPLGDI